ncbi:glycosyltransferase [Pseudomonas sp. LS44]|uniref:glycosyltransferase n=1 Tax=Pseudomonas sp. LS44 TaxID=1357074 RepID=UPI00215A43C7|nr:glycosyltransferase [Pseudomonas sp. LS44]UVE17943.1 glycosyltransferase [Pseudomonas sp. LS44]
MIILVGSKIDQDSIQGALGKPEYSYFFLMKDFLPALERLGEVKFVKSTAEIEALHQHYRAAGEQVLFFSFSPPHQAPLGLACPTVVVFAWEFDSLPDVTWGDNPQNDWRYVFANVQGVICTSQETAGLVRQATGDGFPLAALPAPVWNRYAHLGSPAGVRVEHGERQFTFNGIVIDSPVLGLSADGLVRPPQPMQAPKLKPAPRRLALSWQHSKALLQGWWREVRQPIVSVSATLPATSKTEPSAAQPSAVAAPQSSPEVPTQQLIGVRGVVYTTVLNPADSRKNWLELVTAFCWAFKDVEDATLIVKMTHHDLEHYRVVLLTLLSRLSPFRCRVIVLHGFLDDAQYQALIQASSFYVNASSGEGLCLPLMEFLSAGKPAIAPVHTAMADYVDDQLAFLLQCSLEPFCWPHDPRGVYVTHRHRLNWQSLLEAYQASYQTAKQAPGDYRRMSRHAYAKMQAFASIDAVAAPLEGFLHGVVQVSDRADCQQQRSQVAL